MTIWGIALCFMFTNSRTPIKDSYSLHLSPWRRTKLDCASKRCNKECMLPAVHKREEVTILRMRGSPPRGDVHGVEGHAVISKYTPKNWGWLWGSWELFCQGGYGAHALCGASAFTGSGRLSTGPGLLRHVLLFLRPTLSNWFCSVSSCMILPFWGRNTKANVISFTSYLMEG